MNRIVLFFLSTFFSVKMTFSQKVSPNQLFSAQCSSCHGQTIEAFVDREWKHGKTPTDIMNSIKKGYPELGMPPWETTLSTKEIKKISAYISKSIKKVENYDFRKIEKKSVFFSEGMTLRLDTMAMNIEIPWGITQLPSGELLVTDRKGDLYRIGSDKSKIKIQNIPQVFAKGQGGLLDVEISKSYSKEPWVYLSYSKENPDKKGENTTAIIRGKIENNIFSEISELFSAKPYTSTSYHFGSRIRFDGEGHMYFTVGDRGMHYQLPQRLSVDAGKVHRLMEDGKVPLDNPFVGVDSVSQSIYSYGHRNPQGLIIDPNTHQVWENEHGPRGGDEINRILPKINYGWPEVSYGINYDGKPIALQGTSKSVFQEPDKYYVPSIAPSSMEYITSDRYLTWKNNILIGSLRYNYLERCHMINNTIGECKKELLNIGRIRCVKQGSDGYIYLGLEKPGIVVRLKPE
ncbi:MAG: PQQ-dependent sugar dehydrogenase [Leadbetterella sp.]